MSAVLSDIPNLAAPADALPPGVVAAVRDARAAQPAWASTPLRQRLKVLRRLRHRLAARPDDFAYSVALPQRRSDAETLAAEVLPLADACKWLEREAPELLAPRRLSRRSRPAWLVGVRVTERRDPFGVVLILGTWNYPLFLPGVQAAQALAAGNAVALKPGRDGTAAAEALRDALVACGLDPRLLVVLPEDVASAEAAIQTGIDKVVLTGSAETGKAVLARLAETLTPADMELSGCDAVFVRGDADLDLVVKALTLGAAFNGGATCIAPRRVFAHRSLAGELERRLAEAFMGVAGPDGTPLPGERGRGEGTERRHASAGRAVTAPASADGVARPNHVHPVPSPPAPLPRGEGGARVTPSTSGLPAAPVEPRTADLLEDLVADALARGARLVTGGVDRDGDRATVRPFLIAGASPESDLLKADVFAPVVSLVPVGSDEEALGLDRRCPYALGATVFGKPVPAAELAARIDAGCVVVNDFLIPTADPRVAFGGRRRSGFGVTRGAAGLLAMTLPKTVIEQTSNWRPHLEPATDADVEFFKSYLAAAHGRNWRDRARAGWEFLKEAYRRRNAR